MDVVKILIDSFKISPFFPSINGLTALHFSVLKGYFKIVKFFVNENYVYFNSKRIFNLKEVINSKAGIDSNTCLHYAI